MLSSPLPKLGMLSVKLSRGSCTCCRSPRARSDPVPVEYVIGGSHLNHLNYTVGNECPALWKHIARVFHGPFDIWNNLTSLRSQTLLEEELNVFTK